MERNTIRVTNGDVTEDATIERTVEGYGNEYHKVEGDTLTGWVEA